MAGRHAAGRVRRPQAPPSLNGHAGVDRVLRTLDTAIGAYIWASGSAPRASRTGTRNDGTLELVVARRRVVAHDQNVVELTLASADGARLPAWHPGAHLDLHLPSGRRRQYSLCGDPADRRGYRIAVRLIPDGDGGSLEVHTTLTEKAAVTVSGPRNAFAFVAPGHGSPAGRLRLIAGGIGITPILPMARMADALGVDWSLVHTGRSRDALPFAAEVAALGPRARVRTDDTDGMPAPEDLLGPCAAGQAGHGAPGAPDVATTVYCCGPPPMVAGILDALRSRTDVEFHYERFAAAAVTDGAPFTVELAGSGRTIAVPADRTVLSAVLDELPQTPYSCRQGYCRTCKTTALSGAVEHRDTVLTPAERARGEMLICVSRCTDDRLRLDL
ncbi:PDR/VanB family oxidoreductase [Tomitella fengzijianii]|uniref:Oxidoreductase n=1 Tax=Tomitella fengzijianii TaxID=2597660 RepID=A0A516X548_9ACTN|nr:PDR/VanB family oxidoreductase [Tomitella fengzijianii]QDQ98208.1 oxidoreductase [Tomitella fengzijianii]